MKYQIAKHAFMAITMGAILLINTGPSMANPVSVLFVDSASPCPAVLPNRMLNEEVGPMPPFDADEKITYSVAAGVTAECGAAAGGAGDFTVMATNMTGHDLHHVHVVQNPGTTFGNWDGTIGGEEAKFLVANWPNGAMITFHLLDVAPVASPTFDILGVPHVGASNFSIVACNNGDCVPTVSEWGIALMALLVLSAATILVRGRRNPLTA